MCVQTYTRGCIRKKARERVSEKEKEKEKKKKKIKKKKALHFMFYYIALQENVSNTELNLVFQDPLSSNC